MPKKLKPAAAPVSVSIIHGAAKCAADKLAEEVFEEVFRDLGKGLYKGDHIPDSKIRDSVQRVKRLYDEVSRVYAAAMEDSPYECERTAGRA